MNHFTHTRIQNARQRGSTILLVVAVLLLSMALGMSYMGIVQQDRRSTNELYRSGNLDLVENTVTSSIAIKLFEDLGIDTGNITYPPTGNFFYQDNKNNTVPTVGPPIPDGIPDQEPIDYPYTNPIVPGIQDDQWLANTDPEPKDPASPSGDHVWRHISLLGDRYANVGKNEDMTAADYSYIPLDAGDTDKAINTDEGVFADADGDGINDSKWEELPIAPINGVRYYAAVRIIDNSSMFNLNTSTSQIDASGAYGFEGDSPRWDTPGEMDLGGFINSFNNAIQPATEKVKYISQLAEFQDWRFNGSHPVNNLPTAGFMLGATYDERLLAWEDAWRYYKPGLIPSPYKQLPSTQEAILRHRNGLANAALEGNDSQIDSIYHATTGMRGLLRSDLIAPNPPREFAWNRIVALPGADPTDIYGDKPQYYLFNEPRHQMTTLSGHVPHAPRIGDLDATITQNSPSPLPIEDPLLLKVDLNNADEDDTRDPDGISAEMTKFDLQIIAENIRRVIESSSVANVYELPRGSTQTPLGSPETDLLVKENFANQFAVNIKDYADRDSRVTKVLFDLADPTSTTYGFEALPMITEIYQQRFYRHKWDSGPPAFFTGKFVPIGAAIDDYDQSTSYVIEIRNPFKKPIGLENIHLFVDDSEVGTSLLNLVDGTTTPLVSHLDTLEKILGPEQVAYIIYDAGNNVPAYDSPAYTDLYTEANVISNELRNVDPTGAAEEQQHIAAFDGDAGTVTLELRVETTADDGLTADSTNLLTYQRVSVDLLDDSAFQDVHTVPAGTDGVNAGGGTEGTGVNGWITSTTLGNANGFNGLLLLDTEYSTDQYDYMEYDETDQNLTDNEAALAAATTSQLGQLLKVGAPADKLTKPGQILIKDDFENRIRYVGDLLNIAIFGLSDTSTIAELFEDQKTILGGTYPELDDFRFVIDETLAQNYIQPTANAAFDETFQVPYATILLDRFTTLAPYADGVDNDGDDTDPLPPLEADLDDAEGDEIFIPGTLNINTASYNMLLRALPIPADKVLTPGALPDATQTRSEVANAIIYYRDPLNNTVDRPADMRKTLTGTHSPGFRHLGELLYLYTTPKLVAGPKWPLVAPGHSANISGDTQLFGTTPSYEIHVDFNEDETGAYIVDGVADDREELMIMPNWLMQTCATRSDVFTAYILIRGWPAEEDAPKLKDAIEERRMIYQFDRSGVTTIDDRITPTLIYP